MVLIICLKHCEFKVVNGLNKGAKVMKKILVSGLINTETTVKIKQFPIEYFPIDYSFFGVNTRVSGVAYNLAKALKTVKFTYLLTP